LSENFAYTPPFLDVRSAAEVVIMPKESKSECSLGDDASVTDAFISGAGIFKSVNMFLPVEEALPGTEVKSKLLRKLPWILFLMKKSVICSGNSHSS